MRTAEYFAPAHKQIFFINPKNSIAGIIVQDLPGVAKEQSAGRNDWRMPGLPAFHRQIGKFRYSLGDAVALLVAYRVGCRACY